MTETGYIALVLNAVLLAANVYVLWKRRRTREDSDEISTREFLDYSANQIHLLVKMDDLQAARMLAQIVCSVLVEQGKSFDRWAFYRRCGLDA